MALLHPSRISLTNLLHMSHNPLIYLSLHFHISVYLDRISYTSLYISHPFRSYPHYRILLTLPYLSYHLHMFLLYTSSHLYYNSRTSLTTALSHLRIFHYILSYPLDNSYNLLLLPLLSYRSMHYIFIHLPHNSYTSLIYLFSHFNTTYNHQRLLDTFYNFLHNPKLHFHNILKHPVDNSYNFLIHQSFHFHM